MSLIPWRSKRLTDDWGDDWASAALSRFRGEMDDVLERFLGGASNALDFGVNTIAGGGPVLDVTETDTEVMVRAEVPGVDPKDLKISVVGNVLTISGEKQERHETKGEDFFHSERRFGSFRRSIHLPAAVDTDKVSAEHKNGVVHIRIGKNPGAVPKRIPVKSASE